MLSLLNEYKHINMTNTPIETDHFLRARIVPRSEITVEICIQEASKYKTRTEWRENSQRTYSFAYAEGIQDQCCKHMKPVSDKKRNKKVKWTLESCKAEAQNFKTRSEWSALSPNSYRHACRKGFLEQCVTHMPIVAPHRSRAV